MERILDMNGMMRQPILFIDMNQPQTPDNEVARLREELQRAKELVMDAARRGDQMAAHWKERAEKAEALVKQIHNYAGVIEGFQNPTK